MSRLPPLLPSEALRRVLRMARMDGTCVLLIAGLFALAAAAGHDRLGTVVGLLVAGAGALELHGAGLVRSAQTRGMGWLILSQIYLMVVILGYVAFQMRHVDAFASLFPADLLHQYAAQTGVTVKALRKTLSSQFALIVAVVTVLYQGGMSVYYFRRRSAVHAALRDG
ncbi:MAG: hypothetical protein ACREFX_08430 [Opitutaceae bacterium]